MRTTLLILFSQTNRAFSDKENREALFPRFVHAVIIAETVQVTAAKRGEDNFRIADNSPRTSSFTLPRTAFMQVS
jgi:hypothetical protein